jgi:hypothetical protein
MEDAPNIELGGSGRLVYDKARRTIVSEHPNLETQLSCRTTERDYHQRMADKLADNINLLRPALEEAERFMAYFAGETGGSFVGPGTPTSCLEQIRAALSRT